MGICFTNTKPFDIISLQDEALTTLESIVVSHYELTRNIEDLPMDKLNTLPEKPVIFTIKPLTVLFENVVFPFPDMHAARAVFKEHVIDIKNVPPEQKHKDKNGKLSDESCEMYPMNIIQEIAQIVMQAQQKVPGGTVPFTPMLSDTFSSKKTHLKRQTHLATLMANVQEVDVLPKE